MSDNRLDITAFVCPMTFVRAKLFMETLPNGEVAEIRLQGTEPLQNVPRALQEQGFEIVSISPEASETTATLDDPVHIITVRKPA
jgi:TusA-related sulfurtransferase